MLRRIEEVRSAVGEKGPLSARLDAALDAIRHM
jgi:hypothetical protein